MAQSMQLPSGPDMRASFILSPEQWTADATALVCTECTKPFSLSRRRHHCRVCGGVFCSGCAPPKATVLMNDATGQLEPARACKRCVQSTANQQTAASPQQFACEYEDKGCGFRAEFAEVEAHERTCAYAGAISPPPPPPAPAPLADGNSVRVHGLISSVEHNGKRGTVLGFDVVIQGYRVQPLELGQQPLFLKRENLDKLTAAEEPAGVSFSEDTESDPRRRIVRQQTGVWDAAAQPATDVSFTEDTETAPKRRVERQQTGVWDATAQATTDVSFSEDTESEPRRRIVRQQTGVWDAAAQPATAVSFTEDIETAPKRRVERQQTGELTCSPQDFGSALRRFVLT